MDKNYDHKQHEEKIYDLWEESDSFKPASSGKTFSIILPPPNANAPLHYGHAMYTVEDVMIRFHRMLGDSTLWLPGADHAGFETQVVYEKHLEKEGKSRFDFDRDTLYKNVWDFVQGNRSTMENQLRKLGFSLDWSKKKFTLDEKIVKTVYKTFKKLFDNGLVYRDARLVNYCTKHGTAFSDLEVEHVEKESKLYFIKYAIKDSDDFITIATTRPETIPGDIAIAVHPKDKRYKGLVGKTAINPLNEREMIIIADDYVKKDFGTGALKITPAHDENDFNLGKKHKLQMIQVIGFNGKLNKEAGRFEGLKVLPAREEVVNLLKQNGYLVKEETFKNIVGTCYKCGNVLEPLPLPQWYIKTKDLAGPAIEAVKNKEINILPKRFEKIYFHWLNNIHDWNISRQVVWGIRIPAWHCESCDEWISTEGETPKSCSKCQSSKLSQDTDTFDTWFSSGQWPFATLRAEGEEFFDKFYPTSVMETGYDILFFWVARMVMLSLYVEKQVPFKNVYLHGIVRDSKGQKMSKSKGNVINPLEIMDKYGADALRMSLIAGAAAGNDQNYSETKIIGYRNFSNKIWNIGRFIKESTENKEVDYIGPLMPHINTRSSSKKLLWCYTLIEESNKLSNDVTKSIEQYKFNVAAEKIYDYVWHTLADKHLEVAKIWFKENDNENKYIRGTLLDLLRRSLLLLHPFMPFVTEAVYQELFSKDEKDLLITSAWPK